MARLRKTLMEEWRVRGAVFVVAAVVSAVFSVLTGGSWAARCQSWYNRQS